MSNHTHAIVPIESWCYNSPEIRTRSRQIDIGLLAEALIYYDQILVHPGNQPQFAEMLRYFIQQDCYADLLTLLEDETIQIVDFGFISTPIKHSASNTYSIVNIQDGLQAQPGTFKQRFLEHKTVQRCFRSKKHRRKLTQTIQDKVIEEKASYYSKVPEDTTISLKSPI